MHSWARVPFGMKADRRVGVSPLVHEAGVDRLLWRSTVEHPGGIARFEQAKFGCRRTFEQDRIARDVSPTQDAARYRSWSRRDVYARGSGEVNRTA
jgi:hypothetical protein